jgi:hypothetical protein
MPPADKSWIGLSNYEEGRWEWHSMPADGVLPFDLASEDYELSNMLHVALMVVGDDFYRLDTIGLSDNTPPIANFVPIFGGVNVHEVITIDGSNSYDPDGSIVKYEFDPEGDVSFFDKNMTPNITHTYNKGGQREISVRVTDNEGATATYSGELLLGFINTVRGPQNGNSSYAVLPDNNSNDVFYAGVLPGTGMLGEEAFIGRYSMPGGEPVWEKSFGTMQADNFRSLAQDSQGNLYATGVLNSVGPAQVSLVSISADGDLIWQFTPSFGTYEQSRVAVDAQNNLCFVAEVDAGVGNPNPIFAAKLDLNANIIWQREYVLGDDISLGGICLDDSGNLYICASTYGLSANGRDGLLLSYDSDGALRFDRFFDSGIDDDFAALGFVSGSLVVAGETELSQAGDSLFAGVSTDGVLQWAKTWSSSPFYEGIFSGGYPTDAGTLLFAGNARDSGDNLEAVVISINAGGDIDSTIGLGTAALNDQGLCVCQHTFGGILLGGRLEVQASAKFAELPGLEADLSVSLQEANGADPLDNNRSFSVSTGSYADLTNVTRDEEGAMMACYYAPPEQ